jgi:WD repeat-containing protein 42A
MAAWLPASRQAVFFSLFNASSLLLLLLLLQVVGINAIHVNPARPWQFAVGGSDAWARVYDIRRTFDPPQNPGSSSSSSSPACHGSSLAAAAAAAAACYGRDRFWQRDSSALAAAVAAQQQQRIGPPIRAEARYSRVYGLADVPVARLCPEALWGSRVGGFGGDPSITCVMFSKQGELLASYNDEVSTQCLCLFVFTRLACSSSPCVFGKSMWFVM